MSASGLWTCGTLGKAHGLRGELYLNPAPGGAEYLDLGEEFFLARPTDEPDETPPTPCRATRVGGTDLRPLVMTNLATTREEAISLQGCELLARGASLDAIPHYTVGELMGLPVETESGHVVGTITDVIQGPSHEVLEVETPSGAGVLIPLVDELVSLDDEDGVLRVVDGLLDDAHA